MSREKLFLVVLMLALSITFTKSQADESMVFFTDIHSIIPSPTPQQQDGFSSSPLGIFLLPIATNFNSQYLPTSARSSNFVLQPSNNPTSSHSSPSFSRLPSKSSSILGSTSTLVISTLPSLLPSPTPTTVTPPILITSLPSVAPSTMLIFSPVNTSTSQSFTVKAPMTVDGILTPGSSHIKLTSSIVRTGSDLAFSSTTVRMLMESNIIRSTSMVQVSLSSTVTATTSPPVSMEMMATTLQMTTEDVIVDESTKEEEDFTTRSTSSVAGGASISTPAVIGMVVAACLALIATALLILVLCYCFCRSRKYEYRTGNEYRYTVTVQKWNAHYAHYTANQCDSVSSSRGSSILSSFGFRSSNGKMKARHGGVSSSTDHIHTGATAEMYSTPL